MFKAFTAKIITTVIVTVSVTAGAYAYSQTTSTTTTSYFSGTAGQICG